MVRKTFILILCVLFVFLLSFQCFADEPAETTGTSGEGEEPEEEAPIPITFDTYYKYYINYPYSGGGPSYSSQNNTSGIFQYNTLQLNTSDDTTYEYSKSAYGYGGHMITDGGVAMNLQEGYSYVVTFGYKMQAWFYDGLLSSTAPEYTLYAANYTPYFNSPQTIEINATNFNNYYCKKTSFPSASQNSSYEEVFAYYTYYFHVPVHDPEDENSVFRNDLCYLFNELYVTEENILNSGSNGNNMVWTAGIRLNGYYDPTGEYGSDAETEDVNQIIQGQIDAVQAGLTAEQQSNQTAFDQGMQNASGLSSSFDLSALLSSITQLYNALTYTGNDGTFMFPGSGSIPFLGQLWTAQAIPIKDYIDMVPGAILIVFRFVFWIGFAGVIVHTFYKLIGYINGMKGDDD